MEKRILIVEDDTTLRHILADVMRLAGYTTIVASDGEEGVRLFGQLKPHVVIADIMLPHLDGFEMVRKMRGEDAKAQILFLSARSSSDDVVEGFKAGGHDYLRKPFSMNELMVRVEALFARLNIDDNDSVINIGDYLFDYHNNSLTYNGSTRHLSSRESALLEILAKNMDRVVSSQELLMDIWGDDSYYNLRSMHVFISHLRSYLSNDSRVEIISIRGIGYRLRVSTNN